MQSRHSRLLSWSAILPAVAEALQCALNIEAAQIRRSVLEDVERCVKAAVQTDPASEPPPTRDIDIQIGG